MPSVMRNCRRCGFSFQRGGKKKERTCGPELERVSLPFSEGGTNEPAWRDSLATARGGRGAWFVLPPGGGEKKVTNAPGTKIWA